jgi:hypothetical protein
MLTLCGGQPYVAITNAKGEFVISNIPAGTYTIKSRHEGVKLKKHDKKLNTCEYEDPYESSQQVVVAANADATMNFDLTLRPKK